MNDRVHASKRLLRLEMSFQLFDYTDEIYKSISSFGRFSSKTLSSYLWLKILEFVEQPN